jgi:hypothetical protein
MWQWPYERSGMPKDSSVISKDLLFVNDINMIFSQRNASQA